MFTRYRILAALGSLMLFISGLILGAVGFRFDQGECSKCISRFSSLPKTDAEEYFENHPDPELQRLVKQLSDPSRVDFLPPLLIQTFSDGKRFSVANEKGATIVSELFSTKDSEIVRYYTFKEGEANILFIIARNAETNEINDIIYSFNDSISYVDKNGDGTWDIVRGTTLPAPVIPQANNNEDIEETVD